MLDDVAAKVGKLLRDLLQLPTLMPQTELQSAGEMCDEVRIVSGSLTANKPKHGRQVVAKRDRPHPHQIALVVNGTFAEQCLGLLQILAKEMFASDTTIQIVMRRNLL